MTNDVERPIYVVLYEDNEILVFTPAPGFEQDETWQTIPHCTLSGVTRVTGPVDFFAPIITTTNAEIARGVVTIIPQPQ